MKYRLLLRRVLGVLGVVLASVRLGLARPSAPKASDPHSLNCSSISTRVSDHHTRSTSEELQAADLTRDDDFEDLVVHDHVTPSPSSSANSTQPYSYPNVSLYYYASVESNYFDYYYEDPEDTFSTLEPSHEDQTAGGYQPPPGLARVAKLKLIKTPRRQPPEYMLELYDRFSKAASPVTTRSPEKGSPEVSPDLGADIVRSFPNINKEVPDAADGSAGDHDDTAKSQTQPQLSGRETRHHTLVFNITSLLTGEAVSRAELRLYTLVERDRNTYVGQDRVVRVFEGLRNHHIPPVVSRHVYGHSGGWEAFDVTSVVQMWVSKGSKSGDGIHVLEVSIDSVFQDERRGGSVLALDIDVDPEHNEGPLLVVFSRDNSLHLRHEMQDMIHHEPVTDELAGISDLSGSSATDAKDTNTNGDRSLSRTERATVLKRQSRERFLPAGLSVKPEVPLSRVRRDKRKRNSCRRKKMYVDFQDINWDQWIIAPQGYMAFECVGKCYVPIGAHLSPTKHAIIQTLVHAAYPKYVARACCVPTKLEPISILYLDENNVITYKYHYDEMVVAECGCR